MYPNTQSPRGQTSLLSYMSLTWHRVQGWDIGSMLTRANLGRYIMEIDHQVLLFGSLLVCIYPLHRVWRVKQVWQAFGNLPAYTIFVSPLNLLSRFLPLIPRITSGPDFSWRSVYERQSLPSVRFSPAHSPCTSRCLRSIKVRYCSTPIRCPGP